MDRVFQMPRIRSLTPRLGCGGSRRRVLALVAFSSCPEITNFNAVVEAPPRSLARRRRRKELVILTSDSIFFSFTTARLIYRSSLSYCLSPNSTSFAFDQSVPLPKLQHVQTTCSARYRGPCIRASSCNSSRLYVFFYHRILIPLLQTLMLTLTFNRCPNLCGRIHPRRMQCCPRLYVVLSSQKSTFGGRGSIYPLTNILRPCVDSWPGKKVKRADRTGLQAFAPQPLSSKPSPAASTMPATPPIRKLPWNMPVVSVLLLV